MIEPTYQPTVSAISEPFENPKMNQLIEALKLPQTQRVPPSWVPPKPTFLSDAEAGEGPQGEETTHEGGPHEGTHERRADEWTETATIDPENKVRNVHTAYGTAKQWTRNTDRVMSGLCKWLNGAEDRQQFSVVGSDGNCDSEDFKFMQSSIGDYLETLEINLNPKAAAAMAVLVVYIGYIATGLMYQAKRGYNWGLEYWRERKAEKARDAQLAQEREDRQRFHQLLADAVKAGEITVEKAVEVAQAKDQETKADQAEPTQEPKTEIIQNEYQDPDFRPLAVDAHAVELVELKKRVANGFCVLPSCSNACPPRNSFFCCKDHSNEYFSLQTECNLPTPKEI